MEDIVLAFIAEAKQSNKKQIEEYAMEVATLIAAEKDVEAMNIVLSLPKRRAEVSGLEMLESDYVGEISPLQVMIADLQKQKEAISERFLDKLSVFTGSEVEVYTIPIVAEEVIHVNHNVVDTVSKGVVFPKYIRDNGKEMEKDGRRNDYFSRSTRAGEMTSMNVISRAFLFALFEAKSHVLTYEESFVSVTDLLKSKGLWKDSNDVVLSQRRTRFKLCHNNVRSALVKQDFVSLDSKFSRVKLTPKGLVVAQVIHGQPLEEEGML